MGQIVIDFPMFGNDMVRHFVIKDTNEAVKVFNGIENLVKTEKTGRTPAIEPPRRNSLQKDLKEAFGIWADRQETGEEIALRIRNANRRQTQQTLH